MDDHCVEITEGGIRRVITGKNLVISTNPIPRMPSFEGASEWCISPFSALFSTKHPGKTAIIGASISAVELASALQVLGCQVHIFVRSGLLRGLDAEMAELVGTHLEGLGVTIYRVVTLLKAIKANESQVSLTWTNVTGEEQRCDFDTVIAATGTVHPGI